MDETGLLQDLLSSDHHVFITGAGISRALRQRSEPSEQLPGWPELLDRLALRFGDRLSDRDKDDCRTLLDAGASSPEPQELIQAASILRSAAGEDFPEALADLTTPVDGSTTAMHEVLWELDARGIITFNYDPAHENAANRAGLPLITCLPHDEDDLAELVASRFASAFLLKAHGSAEDETTPPVLAAEDYRTLLSASPAYRAFLQAVLAHHQVLFVGFGLSDPDFDAFLESMYSHFGRPVHHHLAFVGRSVTERRRVLLRRRYGVHTLPVERWNELPSLLREAAVTAGPGLRQTIARCFASGLDERKAAHEELRQLGPAGRRTASAELLHELHVATGTRDGWRAAEAAYSLGVVDPRENKSALMDAVERAHHADVAARALTQLRSVLRPEDTTWLGRQRQTLDQRSFDGNPARLRTYLDYLLAYVPAKFSSDPTS